MSEPRSTGSAHEALPLSLSASQRQAVEFREGVMLVDAGPGAGKTRVVAARVAHLLGRGVPLSQIICLTFSNAAREEMRARIELTTRSSPMVESFHSWARKILVEHDRASHGSVMFTVVDERRQRRALQDAARAEGAGDPETVEQLASAISAAKSRGEAAVGQFRRPEGMSHEQADLVRRVWLRYEHWCLTGVTDRGRHVRGFDFDDMLNEAAELLRTQPALRRRYHDEWRHVLVDEFQDSNSVQYAMVRMVVEDRPSAGTGETFDARALKDRSLVVVADADQAIYGFRGGVPGLTLRLAADYAGLQVAELGENYRSCGHVVLAAAGVIANNRERTQKRLTPTRGEGQKVRVWEFRTPEEEADTVAARCAELWRCKAGKATVAILTRNRRTRREDGGWALHHETLMRALARHGVPAVRDGGVSLGRTPEVAHMRALLSLAADPHDDSTLTRVLAPSARGEVAEAVRVARACGFSLWEALAHSGDEHVISARRTIGRIRDELREGRLLHAFALAFDAQPWVERLFRDGDGEAQDRLRALGRTVAGAVSLESGGRLNSVEDLYSVLEERLHPIRIMTAHAAKGLEWDYVFICGADEQRWRILDEADAEEERRLFYVAMTRARKGLFVSHLAGQPARFVGEIPGGHSLAQPDDRQG